MVNRMSMHGDSLNDLTDGATISDSDEAELLDTMDMGEFDSDAALGDLGLVDVPLYLDQ